MKKISTVFKETSENRIKNNLKDSGAFFVLKYSGSSSPDITALRQSLLVSGGKLFVVKNTIARRALKDSGLEAMIKTIEGPCGLVFAHDEPVGVSKVLYNFSKEHESVKLEGGYLKDKVLERKDIEVLAKLPSQDVLRAQVVMTLKSPITGFVMVLHQTLRKFVYCIEQIKLKKEKGG